MFTFISRYRKYVNRGNGWEARFKNGIFQTDNEGLAQKIREHPVFGKKVFEGGLPRPKGNIIQDIRSAGNRPVFDKQDKLIRLGELRAKLLKKDGDLRKDAPQQEVEELKELEDLIK